MPPTPGTESLIEELRGHGIKITGPRQQVIDHVAGLAANFTAEELAAQLSHVGRATVYRALRLLTDTDLVCRVVMSDGSVAHRMGEESHHHHPVCSDCGATGDVHLSDVERVISGSRKASDYQIEGHRIEIYGVCPRCQAKSR